ncbi:prolactin receptor-like [Erpetoichthys calabaricus]|uniref:prolactin receptor-like n=1 Tax=Erpetoichthys calabaricus TaxID=27687 RepID=UPI002234C6D9|nr:prolactin receptor-like [Erpetoichthys calabaricus]
METFTCWWTSQSGNTTDSMNINYTLTYTVGFGPVNECPDYVTGGSNSCFFDSRHTQIWEVYCLNVKAWNTFGSQTSDEYCLDVADAVEPDPPVNISYKITNDSFGESGKTVVITWQAPETADVDIGWLTLIYELQFRLSSEPEEWKEKGILREPCMELIDLPSGNYMVRVRCKSKNSGRWSKWSRPITMVIPSEKSKGTLLALNLTIGISITAIVVIGLGGAFHGKRIKAFVLPSIPKPRISGIDPLLLKRSNMEEIDHFFSSFLGYISPHYLKEQQFDISLEESFTSVDFDSELEIECAKDSFGSVSVGKEEKESKRIPKLENSDYVEEQKMETSLNNNSDTEKNLSQNAGNVQNLKLFSGSDVQYTISSCLLKDSGNQDLYTFVNAVCSTGTVYLLPCLASHEQPLSSSSKPESEEKQESELYRVQNPVPSSPTSTPNVGKQRMAATDSSTVEEAPENLKYTTVEALHLFHEMESDEDCPTEMSRVEVK